MLHGRVYVYAPVCVAALFLNIVIIFCRFFFFREREMVSPERRANFHEGSCMDRRSRRYDENFIEPRVV